MIHLLLKDIIFNKMWCLLAVIFVATLPLVALEDTQYAYATLFMASAGLFGFIVGKSCYQEDRDDVITFFKTLPISKKNLIISKYMESIMLILCGSGLVLLETYSLKLLNLPYYKIFNFKIVLTILSLELIYCSIYLVFYFAKNYSYSQQSFAIFFIGGLLILKKSEIYLNFLDNYLVSLLLLISFICFLISYKISYKKFF